MTDEELVRIKQAYDKMFQQQAAQLAVATKALKLVQRDHEIIGCESYYQETHDAVIAALSDQPKPHYEPAPK